MPIHRSLRPNVHVPGFLERMMERLRGREQRLVRGDDAWPLLLLSYPRGRASVARDIEVAYTHLLPGIPPRIMQPYRSMLVALPTLVVVLLRPLNPCTCLGHHHARGTETRLTRRLAADLCSPVGEVDLAFDAIRGWQPKPISSMAAGDLDGRLPEFHFQAAVLAVLLHELDHLAFDEKPEREIRAESDQFYEAVMADLVAEESGSDYGITRS